MKQKRNNGWFNAVIRKTRRHGEKTVHYYEIHEVFPDDKGKLFWTVDPIAPHGESIDSLRWALTMMLADTFKMPIYEINGGKLIERTKNG